MHALTEGSRFSKGGKGIYMVKSSEIPWELVTSKKGRRMETHAEGSNSIISWNAKMFLKEDKSCFNKYFQSHLESLVVSRVKETPLVSRKFQLFFSCL